MTTCGLGHAPRPLMPAVKLVDRTGCIVVVVKRERGGEALKSWVPCDSWLPTHGRRSNL